MGKKGIDIEQIKSLYYQGYSPVEIGEFVGCSIANVTRRLKKSGIEFKRDYKKVRHSRAGRHLLNEHYFDFIDTEDKAYFLGLLFSDGSVTRTQFYLKLTDLDILEKFQKVLDTTVPIRTITPQKENWKQSYILEVSSTYMCSILNSLGCTPNKTKTIRMPELNQELARHFIRGFFDGDGCLQLQDKIYHCRFDLTSASKAFLEDVRPIIVEHTKTNGHLGKETKYDVWHLNFSGHQVIQILDWLYKDSVFYIKRKYTKYRLLSSL